MPSTLVLIAALNEEEGIGLTLAELKRCVNDAHVLVVDGNSRDMTVHVAKSVGADVLCQEGVGKGDAVGCGLRHIGDCVDYVVMIDADYTYPASCIPEMVGILESNPEVGMVCGNRFNSHLHVGAMRNMFYVGNRLLAFAHNLMNGVELRDPLTGLRVVRSELLRGWMPKSKGFDIEVELNHHVERRGYSILEIEIPYRPRLGDKKLKISHGFTILKRIITQSMY